MVSLLAVRSGGSYHLSIMLLARLREATSLSDGAFRPKKRCSLRWQESQGYDMVWTRRLHPSLSISLKVLQHSSEPQDICLFVYDVCFLIIYARKLLKSSWMLTKQTDEVKFILFVLSFIKCAFSELFIVHFVTAGGVIVLYFISKES